MKPIMLINGKWYEVEDVRPPRQSELCLKVHLSAQAAKLNFDADRPILTPLSPDDERVVKHRMMEEIWEALKLGRYKGREMHACKMRNRPVGFGYASLNDGMYFDAETNRVGKSLCIAIAPETVPEKTAEELLKEIVEKGRRSSTDIKEMDALFNKADALMEKKK